jgi:phosphopantetheinyl transferase
MPLVKTINISKNTLVLVWKISESLQELSTVFLNEESLNRIQNMRSQLHQKGFISVRHLLAKAGYSDADLFYNQHGKPHLKDGKNISITHSFNFSSIIISDIVVGIDIEKNRDKITRIAHKFVDQEYKFLQEERLIEQLTILWGAKESLYKIHPDGGLSFKENLPIDSFTINDSKTTGTIIKDSWHEKFDIFFEKIEDFTLVYALPQNKLSE